jgi:predicted phage-related endonuclease
MRIRNNNGIIKKPTKKANQMNKMQIVKLEQGSPEWLEHRESRFNASDAAAMLGFSNYKKREELLHEYKTGERKPVSPGQQKRFDEGHRVEALARRILEDELDEELYSDVGILDYDGLPLGSSFDGLSMLWDLNFEHKLWNAKLVNFIDENDDLPDSHWPQVEQQMLMSGSEITFFIVSDGTKLNRRTIEYKSNPKRQASVILGWKQFQKDLIEYKPRVEDDKVVADEIETLPTLKLDIKGEVSTNMPVFKEKALEYIRGINTNLVEDVDFVNAEADIKFCKDAEKQLKDIKETAFANTAAIKEAMEAINDIGSQLREKRLTMEKLVKSEKEARKTNLVFDSSNEIAEHIIGLEPELQGYKLPGSNITDIKPIIESAIKNKRTMDSMRSAASTAIANCKIEFDQSAKNMRENLALLDDVKDQYGHLFSDFASYITGAKETAKLMIESRIREEKDRVEAAEKRKREAEQKKIEDAKMAAEIKKPAPVTKKPIPSNLDQQGLSLTEPEIDLDGQVLTISGSDFSRFTLEDLTGEFKSSNNDYQVIFKEIK